MIYRFGTFELDTERNELRQGAEIVSLPRKPFSVLLYLIEGNDRMVPKSELLDAFWSTEVSEAALQTAIRVIRKALGEAGAEAIKTYHGQGVRFVAPLDLLEPEEAKTEAAPLRERRLVSVLAVKFGVDGANAAPEVPEGFLAETRARVEADHGQLLHMMMDGFTAVFGLAADGEDSARRAVACGWHIATSDPEMTAGIGLRCGVDTGQAAVAAEGQDAGWTLPGIMERRATELAAVAPAGGVMLGHDAVAQLRGEVQVQDKPGGFLLCGAPQDRAGIPLRSGRPRSRFVGRDAEIAFLRSNLARALDGAGQAVTLSGPAGIGKSRLVQEFLDGLEAGQVSVQIANCLPRLADTPLAPLRHVCRTLCPEPPSSLIRDEIDQALFLRLTDQPLPSAMLEGVSEYEIRHRSRALFTGIIARHCAGRPLVLAVEDAHWLDADSRAHLATLIDRADSLALLIVLTTRPIDKGGLSEAILHLSPLRQNDCRDLLRTMPEIAAAGDALKTTLVERAGGNPFFLEELALASQSGRAPDADLPNTVQAVMEVRIASLKPALRALLYAAAILGPPAPVDVVAGILGIQAAEIEADLQSLIRGGFLRDDADGASFRHMLMHDTAYGMISPEDRRRLHREAARLLEERTGEASLETLALHWQEGGDPGKAAGYWTKASNAALSRSAGQPALTFARKGLALIDPEDPAQAGLELGLQLSLAPGLMALRGYGAEEVGQAYGRAHDLSVRTGSAKAQVRALLGLWVHSWVAGRLSDAVDHGRALLVMAERADDAALRLQGHSSIGSVLMHTGELSAAADHLAAGLAELGDAPPTTVTLQNAAVTCASYAAWVHALRGQEGEARRLAGRSEGISRALENPFARAIHMSLCADMYQCLGDRAASQALASDAVSLSRERGFPFWLGTARVIEGWAMGDAGDPEAGLAAIDEGIAVFGATEARVQMPNWLGFKAETLLKAGRLEEALGSAEEALARAAQTGDVWFAPRIHATASAICERLGLPDAAAAHRKSAEDMQARFGLCDAFVGLEARLP